MINQICVHCDGLVLNQLFHNCVRGITENINRLHSNVATLMVKNLDHLDGLKYALKIIEELESYYKLMGIDYVDERYNPFHDMRNKIRMYLGLPLSTR